MSCRNRTRGWTAAALSLFLVFVLPVCWYGALTQAWIERGQGPSSNNTNEEREEREHNEEAQVVRAGSRPPTSDTQAAARPVRAAGPKLQVDRIAVASVAPKPHPSRFSVRRLR